jgi:hypothetical protein
MWVYDWVRSCFLSIYGLLRSIYDWILSWLRPYYDWLRTWFRSFYDWFHFGYSHKRRRRAGYPKCPDFEKTKRLEKAYNRIVFWKKAADIYECQNDNPILKIDWYERHLMDIGVKEETYEYYRAKKIISNEWSDFDEETYDEELDAKIPFNRFEALIKIDSIDRWQMDFGLKEETYEYYRAKKIKNNKWSKADEEAYDEESDPKTLFKRVEPLIKIDSKDCWNLDRGLMKETYEYHRAKKIKYNEWSEIDEEIYKKIANPKISYERVKPRIIFEKYGEEIRM